MKTIVLALDALESTLIDLWSLDEFKQKHFGLYDTSQLEALSTPICFSAILTGKNPKTYGYTLSYLTQNIDHGYAPWLRPLVWMRRTLLKGFGNIGLRGRARDLGLFNARSRNMTEDLKELTILRKLEGEGYQVKTDNVPSYDEDPQSNFRGHMFHLIGGGYKERDEHVNELLIATRKRWLRNLNELSLYDLMFVYSPLPDTAHHLVHHVDEMMLLERVYRCLRDLPMLFSLNDVALLILSDHGYVHQFNEAGKDIGAEHSTLGFWSVNVDIDLEPKSVFDFHDLIYDLVTR